MSDYKGLFMSRPETNRIFYEKALALMDYAVLRILPKEDADAKVVLAEWVYRLNLVFGE